MRGIIAVKDHQVSLSQEAQVLIAQSGLRSVEAFHLCINDYLVQHVIEERNPGHPTLHALFGAKSMA